MSDNNIIQNQLKLYQKLYSFLPQMKNVEYDKKTVTIYNSDEKSFWFAKTEKHNKFYYHFGLRNQENIEDSILIIDIDKENEYSPESIGWLIENTNGVKLLLNLDMLNEKYPNIDTSEFNSFHVKSGKIYRNYIDLSYIDSNDFIINLEKIIKKTPDDSKNTVKVVKNNNNTCEICKNNKNSPNVHSNVKRLLKNKPNFCGNCIEKIITCEFFKKVNPLITNNETKTLRITREKYSNDEEFDFGLKLLEKYNIIKYIGIKKLFFTLDKDNLIIKKYSEYVDENNYLIDHIFSKKSQKTNKEKQRKINLFLNALESGKNKNEALNISKLSNSQIEEWYSLGRNGDLEYKEFYEKYDEYRIPKVEMNRFIKELKKKPDLKIALNKTDLSFDDVKKWYELGKNNNNEYIYFYRICNDLLPNGFIIKDEIKVKDKNNDTSINKKKPCKICGRKIIKNNKNKICKRCAKKQYASKIVLKLLKHFKTEETFKKEDLNVLNLKELQITEYIWTLKEFNLITEKNNKYKLINENKLEEFIKSSGIEINEISKENNQQNLYRTCKKCGKSLLIKSNFNNDKNICKNCKKLTNTAKYLSEILNFVEFNKEFKQDDLKPYFNDSLQLQAKLWALADNDLIKKNFENDTYILADKQTINDFLHKYSDNFFAILKNDKINESDAPIINQDDGILTMIPEDIEKSLLKRSKGNNTGFAWVNKIGNTFKYTRSVNGRKIDLKDHDIHKLYYKVIHKNLTWGVRDINKARKIVNAEETVKNKKTIKKQVKDKKSTKNKKYTDPGIYAPIPEEYLTNFRKQSNKTGIAWVNITGKTFTYSRTVNGNNVLFREPTIEKLYSKVKFENQIWGIRDYSRASKYIDIPQDFEIPEIKMPTKKDKKPASKPKNDIYNLFPKEEITNSLVRNSPTGIAWVSKNKNRWVYNRKYKNQIIRLSAENIRDLYDKVIANNGVWGIIDIDKAKAIIDPENKNKNVKNKTKLKGKNNIIVTYIEKSKTRTEIIIKGRVKISNLLEVINQLEIFELNFKRIVTTTINNNVDLFIELEMSKNSISFFEKQINKYGWEIII